MDIRRTGKSVRVSQTSKVIERAKKASSRAVKQAARNRNSVRKIRERQKAEREKRSRKRRVQQKQLVFNHPVTCRKSLSYVKHGAAGRYYVRIINDETGEVIREVPSREELDRIAVMKRFLRKIYSTGV